MFKEDLKNEDYSSRRSKGSKGQYHISELIAQENVETPEYVTVSVNDEFAKSADFETQQLKDGDNVEFLYFMGGGQ